ncbi:MAG: vWA domain-containing protein [Phycisphaerae bacterium]|nr:vWA domain-containing protein [Phycisphaerae bacterium]
MKTVAGNNPTATGLGCRAGRLAGPFVLGLGLLLHGCDRSPTPGSQNGPVPPMNAEVATHLIPLPQADQRLCTAVVILVDTSGSMNEAVVDRQGVKRPKYLIARDALNEIIDYTGQWEKTHTDRVLEMALFNFSSSPSPVLRMGRFDPAQAQQALRAIPQPGGGTAIGEAVEEGFKALYQSGCVRKYLICITDGENTAGRPPDRVSRQLYAQTQGEVEMHFIAFDTSVSTFGFLSEVNGHTTEAADGAQLQARLTDIYEKRILAEAPAEKE